MKILAVLLLPLLFVSLFGCASSFLQFDKAEELKKNDEFEKLVQIIPTEVPPEEPAPAKEGEAVAQTPDASAAKAPTPPPPPPPKPKPKKSSKKQVVSEKRQPPLENGTGFEGNKRRPTRSPYRVGEKVVHAVRYFKVTAGELAMEVKPYKYVNGRKSYSFVTSLKSSSTFSTFYTVDDWAETLVDFETLLPSVYTLHVKESGQLREGRAFFDQDNHKVKFWEKKVTKKKGMQEVNKEVDMAAYSQNVYSAAYYMRIFNYEVGQEYAFSVAEQDDNVVFKGKVLRKEVLETDVGTFNAIVIQPTFELKGFFKPVGDIFMWLSDDDRRYVLRIESAIKIGTLVSEVISIEPGSKTLD